MARSRGPLAQLGEIKKEAEYPLPYLIILKRDLNLGIFALRFAAFDSGLRLWQRHPDGAGARERFFVDRVFGNIGNYHLARLLGKYKLIFHVCKIDHHKVSRLDLLRGNE